MIIKVIDNQANKTRKSWPKYLVLKASYSQDKSLKKVVGFLIVLSRLLIYLFFMNVKGKNFSFASASWLDFFECFEDRILMNNTITKGLVLITLWGRKHFHPDIFILNNHDRRSCLGLYCASVLVAAAPACIWTNGSCSH